MTEKHDWLLPSPLWTIEGHRQVEFYRPALFEYQGDDFMDKFLAAVTATNPGSLMDSRLPAKQPLPKLFQPAHGSFYLTAASLCCREPGFPSRDVRQTDGETVSFVIRKLIGGKEYGWVVEGEKKDWKPLNGFARGVLQKEERLPLFQVALSDGRPLYCGYVPTSSSETYNVSPSELSTADTDPKTDVPLERLDSIFVAPLSGKANQPSLMVDLPEEIAWETSVYLLVDLWDYLTTYFPGDFTEALQAGNTSPSFNGEKAAERSALFQFLNTQSYKGSLTLAKALKNVADKHVELNATERKDLPTLGFSKNQYSLKGSTNLGGTALQNLLNKVKSALPAERPPVEIPKLDVSSSVQYVLRFVYERTQCDPPQVEVSMPSQAFTLAPFFDPDAPARPVRIPLPSNVSIAGLRKFKKNVTFMMSDAMRKKMQSITGQELKLFDNPELSEPANDFAFVCSFSFQIIFMVAFMLLMIFVVVFNMIFWWMPFFKICLPVPKKLIPQ